MTNVIGLMHVKNESDIIAETINYYATQGVKMIVIDDHSDDDSFEICQALSQEDKILELHRTSKRGAGLGFRNPALNNFQNPFLTTRRSRDNLMIGEALSIAEKYEPDWVLVADADCFLETRDGSTLQNGLAELQALGYDTVEFFRINFFPTRLDDLSTKTIRERIRHYVPLPSAPLDWSRHCGRFRTGMYVGKHHIEYPGQHLRIPDRVWIYRHYPFRSYKQAVGRAKTSQGYQFGSRSEAWQNLLIDEETFYRVSPLMRTREEGRNWGLRFDILEKDKLRSNDSHNAHEYILKQWPSYPK